MIRNTPTPITPLRPSARPGRRQAASSLVWGTGIIMLGLAAASSWFASRTFDDALARLDERTLRQGAAALDRELERQRAQALSQVRLLADDNRVRATVITPRFDEATVGDVLEDLRRASGATVLAVLDVSGKIAAASGLESFKKETLGQAAAVKAAMERPTADVWSFPDRVLVIAVAPILSGSQVAALMMVGLEVGAPTLASLERTMGASSGLVVGDRLVARSSPDPTVGAALEMARTAAEGTSQVVDSGRKFLARVTRTGDPAAAARVVWLVPHQHQSSLFGPVPGALWMPVLAVVAMLLLSIVWTRR